MDTIESSWIPTNYEPLNRGRAQGPPSQHVTQPVSAPPSEIDKQLPARQHFNLREQIKWTIANARRASCEQPQPLTPFLTDLDPRAAVKGSRDPLGIQAIWTRFGRHVVGNLSTVSNSVRDFTVLILGYYFAEKVAETAGPGMELATFLKWEQLAAYARFRVNNDRRFRGTERVNRNLEENEIILSAEPAHQILSSQKAYGIWGLYSVPGRASDLLEGQPAQLTPLAKKLVENTYLQILAKAGLGDGRQLVELLARERVKFDVRRNADEKILKGVAALLKPGLQATEREFYRYHLLFGGPQDETEGRQKQLAELIEPKLTTKDFLWSPAVVAALAKEAESKGTQHHAITHYLRRIETAERMLAPASELFTYLLGCDGVAISEIEHRIRKGGGWGNRVSTVSIEATAELKVELSHGDDDAGKRWLGIADTMAHGDYPTLIALLIQQNKTVMLARGGAAWIEEERGKLKARVTEERGNLPRREDLPDLWRFPYFLDSLCSVARTLKGKEGQAL